MVLSSASHNPHISVLASALPKINIPHIDVSGADLPHIDLPHMDLPQIDLTHVDLPQIDIPRINIPQVSMPQVDLADSLDSLSTFINRLQAITTAAISHPLWAVVIVIVGIGFLQLVADLVKRILKTGLKLILTLPLTLSQWLWKRATASARTAPDDKARIAQLLDRLDALRTEQDQVVAELKRLLNSSGDETKQPLPSVDLASLSPQKSVELPQS